VFAHRPADRVARRAYRGGPGADCGGRGADCGGPATARRRSQAPGSLNQDGDTGELRLVRPDL